MKPTSSFKMPKTVKRMLATITDRHEYGQVKRGFISAVLASNIKVKSSKEDRNKEVDTE